MWRLNWKFLIREISQVPIHTLIASRFYFKILVAPITVTFYVMLYFIQTSDALPTAQTCFFQIRLPVYRSQQVMAERLRYAIRNCRSIDMDNYMLRRTPGEWENDEELWFVVQLCKALWVQIYLLFISVVVHIHTAYVSHKAHVINMSLMSTIGTCNCLR